MAQPVTSDLLSILELQKWFGGLMALNHFCNSRMDNKSEVTG